MDEFEGRREQKEVRGDDDVMGGRVIVADGETDSLFPQVTFYCRTH